VRLTTCSASKETRAACPCASWACCLEAVTSRSAGRCGDLRDYLLRICSTLLQLQCNGGINPDDSDLLQVASSFDVDLLVIILLYVVLLEVYAV